MKQYLVQWELELEAEDPLDAAIVAREIAQDPKNMQTIYAVVDMSDENNPDPPVYSVDVETGSIKEIVVDQEGNIERTEINKKVMN